MTFRHLPAYAVFAVLGPACVVACAADPGDAPKGLGGASSTVSVSVHTTASGSANTGTYVGSATTSSNTGVQTSVGNTGVRSTSGSVGTTASSSSATSSTVPPCTTCTLMLTYEVEAKGTSASIGFNVRVLNSGTGSQDLSQVTIRYYFTTDTQTALAGQINTASITEPAGPNYYAPVAGVTMTFTPMTTPTTTADTYVEFGFPAGTSLPANATLEVDVQFHAGDNQGTFNQANDYSYNGNAAAFTPSNTITVYASGTLVSGTEPM